MAQMTNEVSKLLQKALSLSVEEQEALAESLISLGDKIDGDAQAAWEAEIARRVAELDSGKVQTIPWSEVRRRNLAKLPDGRTRD
jgi:putative addiction module component (TIGR02574 family)